MILSTHRHTLSALAGLLALGCAVNPATGKRQLSLVGEGKEIALGRQNDTAVVASMGLYADSAWQAYVRTMGGRLAAGSERPDLPWTFRVVDDPVINAFALPGGFIYVTRGILAHLNSEAQLAAVLGHEIGHVTARHSVEQMSRQQLAQVGLGIGMVFSQEVRAVGDLAGAGLGVLFLKFGRDDESQADALGLRYIMRAGYDPRPMAGVFTMLGRVSAGAEGKTPSWLSTHPDPENRREAILQQIAALPQPLDGRTVGADTYLRRLDGLVYGENPRDGFFRDNVFLHPDLAFEIAFPVGWKTANQRDVVGAVSTEQDAMIQLSVVEGATVDAAADVFFDPRTMRAYPRRATIHGLPAVLGEFAAATQQGNVAGLAAFIGYRGRVFRVVGYGTAGAWPARAASVERAIGSFAELTDTTALGVQPLRVQIVELPGPMSLSEFAAQWPSDIPRERVFLLNQGELATQFPAGALLKRVVRAHS